MLQVEASDTLVGIQPNGQNYNTGWIKVTNGTYAGWIPLSYAVPKIVNMKEEAEWRKAIRKYLKDHKIQKKKATT